MIGISPDHLELDLSKNGASSQNIFLKNLDTREIKITIRAEKYSHYLEIDPRERVLSAAGESEVRVTAKAGKNFSTNLEIIFYESSEIGAGIKIPINVSGNKFIAQYQYGLIIAAAFIITLLVYAINTKRQKMS